MINIGKWTLKPHSIGYHCFAELTHKDGDIPMTVTYDMLSDIIVLKEDINEFLSIMGPTVVIDDDWWVLLKKFRKKCNRDHTKHLKTF